jgi:hypothetical protein
LDVNQVYKLVLYCAAKNLSQGYVSPEDFNTVIMPLGQRSYLDYLLGEYQKYQIQRPIAVVEFGQNQRIRDSISPLIYNTILPVNSTTGIASRPSDFEYTDAMWGVYGNYNIRFIQQDRYSAYKYSEIDPVVENPVYLLRHEGFQFFPERPYGENQAAMSYVRTPPSIVWGYDLDSNGIPVYNPSKSQDPVWSDTDMLQIIVRGLQAVGVSLQLGVLIQYSQEIKNGGQ